jgi:hypothetical protein
MHAKHQRQGRLGILFHIVWVPMMALVTLFKVVLFKVVRADEPKHLKSTGRSKGWGRKVVFIATAIGLLLALAAPAFASTNHWVM